MSSSLWNKITRPREEEIANTLSHAAGLIAALAGATFLIVTAVQRGRLNVIGGAVRCHKFSTGVYLGMGWLFLITVGPVWQRLPAAGLLWLLAGGIAYTVGVGFFLADKARFNHLVWHLFVLTGTACHFVAVWRYAA
jgi:predicted membrane channel-forming protein YqfA (hemolysin III family)